MLFNTGTFSLASGAQSIFKIDCDALTKKDWEAIAYIVQKEVTFRSVEGVPKGGLQFAEALLQYSRPFNGALPHLIVDDVLTTGGSMEWVKKNRESDSIGVVLFARGPCPDWVTPVFQLTWPILGVDGVDESNILSKERNG